MHRIDTPGATTDNRFQGGNPAAGIKGTEVDAAWLNAVQEEIVGVLTVAGATPSKLQQHQLASAIQSLIAAGGVGGGGVAMTGSNLGTAVPVFAGVVDTDFRFRTLRAGSGVAIAQSANEVTITATGGGGGTVSSASETVAGIVELATAAETAAGIDATRAVHPAGAVATFPKKANNLGDLPDVAAARTNLSVYSKAESDGRYAAAGSGGTAAPNASETVAGIVELATATETAAGIDTTRAVHPAGAVSAFAKRSANLSDLGDASTARNNLLVWSKAEADARYAPAGSTGGGSVSSASETVAGIVELATATETAAGIDTTRAVHPAGAVATFARRSANLSDLGDAAAARTNLGLGSAAAATLGTAAGNVPTRSMADGLYAQLSGAAFIGAVSAPSFNSTSSARFKKGITRLPLHDAVSLLSSIEVVSYRMRSDDRYSIGVIAERLAAGPLAFCVRRDDEGRPSSVDYQPLFALALAALQDQVTRLGCLERRMQAVEGRDL